MNKSKLMQFLQDKILNYFFIRKNCKIFSFNLDNRGSNKNNQTFKYNTIQKYKMALVDL